MASKARIKAADRVFSKFIRLRDCRGGYGYCCSCGKIITYETCDAGHFVNRRWMMTRYDERNVNAQCRSCNRFDEGNNVGYVRFIQRKYGDDVVDLLISMKKNYSWSDFELRLMIEDWNKRIKEMI